MENFDFHNKNVVILIKDAILGGAERQALGFAKYIKDNFNCKVSVVVIYSIKESQEFTDFMDEIEIQKMHYFGEPSLSIKREISIKNLQKAFRALRYLIRITIGIRKLKPDILVPFMNGPSKIASLIYNFTGAKTTFWHQLGLEVYFYDWLEQVAIKKVPFIIANSENGLDIIKTHYQVQSRKLSVLPQYAAIKRKRLNKIELKEKFSLPPDALIIGMIAHYRKEKFQELLIEAFSEIASDRPIHLILLGNKDNNGSSLQKYEYLDQMVESLKMREKVTILSGIDVHEVLNVIDIGVLMSEIEGTPNVVMEYMLYGLPVIATNHKGCIGLLENSTFLIPNDKDVLADKIVELVVNPDIRKSEGEANLFKIEKYSPKKYFDKLTAILNNINN